MAQNKKCESPEENVASSRSLPKALILRVMEIVFPDRQFISLLKFELYLFLITIYSLVSPVEWVSAVARRNDKDLKINIGNGPFEHGGWLNLDCRLSLKKSDVVCDLRRRWPFPAESAKYIFAEHVLEHFSYPDGINHILKECYRVLKPGGVLRVVVPHAERYLRAYANNDESFATRLAGESASVLSLVNLMMRENGFHKYAYDFAELMKILNSAGFHNVKLSSLKGSEHDELNLDFDDSVRDLVSLYVEASK